MDELLFLLLAIVKMADNPLTSYRFINGIVEFLIDMGWIEYNYTRGLYQMTAIGEINVSALKVIIWI